MQTWNCSAFYCHTCHIRIVVFNPLPPLVNSLKKIYLDHCGKEILKIIALKKHEESSDLCLSKSGRFTLCKLPLHLWQGKCLKDFVKLLNWKDTFKLINSKAIIYRMIVGKKMIKKSHHLWQTTLSKPKTHMP